MKLRRRLKALIERLTKTRIYRVLPRGLDLAYDLAHALPKQRVEVIFDVGANLGQSAQKYVKLYPQAQIYSFEPVQATFQQLKANLKGQRQVRCYQVALGSTRRTGQLVLQGTADMFFLADQDRGTPQPPEARTETIEIMTLDEFCRAAQVNRINYLKIDTEGSDLEVLRGAETMLNAQLIDLVEFEAGMNRANQYHVPFEVLKQHLEARSYVLFGLYEQMHEWPTNQPQLRRINPVFISQRVIDLHSGV
jgi:FkbM family methyltransferase